MTAPRPLTAPGARESGVGTVEQPLYLPAAGQVLFGVHAAPAQPTGAGVVLLHNGPYNMTSHKNGVWVRLAEALAALGISSLRVDFAGTGDSSGAVIERGVAGQATVDALAAVEWLRDHGCDRVLLAGTCRGALVCLYVSQLVDGLAGLYLGSPPVLQVDAAAAARGGRRATSGAKELVGALRGHLAKSSLRDPEYWAWLAAQARKGVRRLSPGGRPDGAAGTVAGSLADQSWVPAALEHAVDRRIPVRFLYGTGDPHYERFDELRSGPLAAVVGSRARGELVGVEVVPGRVHGFTTIEGQQRFLDSATSWIGGVLG